MNRQRYFQWLDGDLEGSVETLKYIECVEGEYFYHFASGETCNVEFIAPMTRDTYTLKGKVMVEITNPNDKWKTEVISTHKYTYMDPTSGEQTVDVPPLEDIVSARGTGQNIDLENSQLGKKKFYPPRYKGPMLPLPSYDEYGKDEYYATNTAASVVTREQEIPAPTKKVETSMPVERPVQKEEDNNTAPALKSNAQKEVISNDPVYILAKTSKKHDTEIELTLNINLPSKAIFTLAESEFDNGGQKFVNYLVDEIDPNIILSALKVALLDSYTAE